MDQAQLAPEVVQRLVRVSERVRHRAADVQRGRHRQMRVLRAQPIHDLA
jgi:hypothetical protein